MCDDQGPTVLKPQDIRREVTTSTQSAEVLNALMQLQCRREILERWLASDVLPAGLQQSLQTMLAEVEEQLGALARRSSN